MKKSLLALAVAALATTASAATVYDKDGTSVDMYGRLQSVIYSTHTDKNGADDNTMRTTARFGLNLRQQVTPGFAVFGKAEWDTADGQDHDGFDVRYMWVGADFGKFGSVKAGRFEDAVKYVLLPTDIFDDWGCKGQAGNDDKRDSMFGYYWSGYGVDVNLTVSTASDSQQVDGAYSPVFGIDATNNAYIDSVNEKQNINDSYAVSVGYTSAPVLFGPIAVRLGYGHVDFQDVDDGGSILGGWTEDINSDGLLDGVGVYVDDYDQYAASASWGTLNNGLYLAALYQARQFDFVGSGDYDVTGAEGVVSYAFANGLRTSLGINYKKLEVEDMSYEYLTLPVYVNYQVSPAFNVWAEARFDLGSDDTETADDELLSKTENVGLCENVYSVGARYTF